MAFHDNCVNYEAFGAIGDGMADDLDAICKAHDYANTNGLSVRSKSDATYHLGARALTVKIATDTDWNTSRFTIDDTHVEDHKITVFKIISLLESETLPLSRLSRDQKIIDLHPQRDCYVRVEDDRIRHYIRRGPNQNSGEPQQDCFILRRDGCVEGPIDWNYDAVSHVEVHPIDDKPLVLRGGVFTTVANQMREVGYNYWARNILISRSNTLVEGLTHYVVGETAYGSPYTGFLDVRNCADVTLKNCFATGHKIYSAIGSQGVPVSMGSYDYHANNVVNLRLVNCRMNHITDRTRWGVIASNFCKNILLEDCTLSRMDTHMGVSGTYTIRRCTLGHMGLNAIGRGTLTIEDSTLYGGALICLRGDYGSTWDGDVVVKRSRWIPACGDTCQPYMIHVRNDGMHDFGYPCQMPREIRVEGLFVDDKNHPEDYEAVYIFNDPDIKWDGVEDGVPMADRPFPYQRCQKISITGFATASGRKLKLSPNLELAKVTVMTISP